MKKQFKLIHGDCLKVMRKIPNNAVHLIVTSPPYYNAREYSQYKSVDAYMQSMKDIFCTIYDKLKPSRMCAINISSVLVARSNRNSQSYRIPLPFYYVPMMESLGYEFLEDLIWVKPDGAVPNRNGSFSQHRKPLAYKPNLVTEYILVFKKPAPFLIDKVMKNSSLVTGEYERTNVWHINPETKSEHPAPFPITLPNNLIKYYSYRNETVLDPFMGSGTTGVVAVNCKRKFIGIEQDGQYYKLAKARIESIPQSLF